MTETMIAPESNDAVISTLTGKIVSAVEKVEAANVILLAEEKGTPVKDIDKVLKSDEAAVTVPENVLSTFAESQALAAKAKELLNAARNAYRTEVLGEDTQDDAADEEKETLKNETKEIRDLAMESLKFLNQYAGINGHADVAEWANTLEVPQVGRKASSSVGGTGSKKYRVNVTVDEKPFGSFTEAALALTDKDNKVAAGDLAEAWVAAIGETDGEFEFSGHVVTVEFKNKK